MTCAACIVEIETALKRDCPASRRRASITPIAASRSNGRRRSSIRPTPSSACGAWAIARIRSNSPKREARRGRNVAAAAALPRRRGLRGDERHAAVGLRLGRQRQRHRRPRRAISSIGVSALIALPAAAFAGQPVLSQRASRALRARSLNMDVPISLGVLLALGMSVCRDRSARGSTPISTPRSCCSSSCCSAAISTQTMRQRRAPSPPISPRCARRSAARIGDDGSVAQVPLAQLAPGDLVLVRPGERIPVDGVVRQRRKRRRREPRHRRDARSAVGAGRSRSMPARSIFAARCTIRVRRSATARLLDEIERLLEDGERARGRATSASPIARRASMRRSCIVTALADRRSAGCLRGACGA